MKNASKEVYKLPYLWYVRAMERRTWSFEKDGCPNFYHGFTTKFYKPTEFDPSCSACVKRRDNERRSTH